MNRGGNVNIAVQQQLQQVRNDVTQLQNILRMLMNRHTALEERVTNNVDDDDKSQGISESKVSDLITKACEKVKHDLQRERIVMEAMLTEKAEKTAARVVMLSSIAVPPKPINDAKLDAENTSELVSCVADEHGQDATGNKPRSRKKKSVNLDIVNLDIVSADVV
jgi:hypothetical protein